MDSKTIKKQAVSGVLWKFAERICAQGVSLVVSIILARILLPKDYSVVSIVTIFFAFCNVFISGGLGSALIQKKNTDVLDYSTILYSSLAVAGVLYVAMFFSAPYIADLYENQLLVPITKVMALTFFVNAFKSVLCAYVSHNMMFRKFFWATIVGTVISAVVGIVMAENGFGAWALVAQQMTNSIIDSVILLVTTRMKFVLKFSIKRFKELFSYSWKIFLSSIISTIYTELKPLIVGTKFSTTDLAYYTKGHSFPAMANSTISNTIMGVIFPTLSKFQDDKAAMLAVLRRYIKVSSFVIFPMMLGLASVSETFVKIVLTEKWLPAVPYIRLFCACYMVDLINIGNLQAIKAVGRTDINLITEIIKKSTYFIIIALFVKISASPIMFSVSNVLCVLIAVLVNTFPNRKILGYRYRLQITDVLGNLINAIIMYVCVSFVEFIPLGEILRFFVQILVGFASYLILSLITKNDNLKYILDILKRKKQ